MPESTALAADYSAVKSEKTRVTVKRLLRLSPRRDDRSIVKDERTVRRQVENRVQLTQNHVSH